jgi:hypothetical protein
LSHGLAELFFAVVLCRYINYFFDNLDFGPIQDFCKVRPSAPQGMRSKRHAPPDGSSMLVFKSPNRNKGVHLALHRPASSARVW